MSIEYQYSQYCPFCNSYKTMGHSQYETHIQEHQKLLDAGKVAPTVENLQEQLNEQAKKIELLTAKLTAGQRQVEKLTSNVSEQQIVHDSYCCSKCGDRFTYSDSLRFHEAQCTGAESANKQRAFNEHWNNTLKYGSTQVFHDEFMNRGMHPLVFIVRRGF